jgi:hypothetical protein
MYIKTSDRKMKPYMVLKRKTLPEVNAAGHRSLDGQMDGQTTRSVCGSADLESHCNYSDLKLN